MQLPVEEPRLVEPSSAGGVATAVAAAAPTDAGRRPTARALAVATAVAALYILQSAVAVVSPSGAALRYRLGESHDRLGPGIHGILPLAVDAVVPVAGDRVHDVHIGVTGGDAQGAEGASWRTADGLLVDVRLALGWRALTTGEGWSEDALQRAVSDAAASALAGLVGGLTLGDLLAADRAVLATELAAAIDSGLAKLAAPAAPPCALSNVQLLAIAPIAPATDAFAAWQRGRRDDALADAAAAVRHKRWRAGAAAEAEVLVSRARADAEAGLAQTRADLEGFALLRSVAGGPSDAAIALVARRLWAELLPRAGVVHLADGEVVVRGGGGLALPTDVTLGAAAAETP